MSVPQSVGLYSFREMSITLLGLHVANAYRGKGPTKVRTAPEPTLLTKISSSPFVGLSAWRPGGRTPMPRCSSNEIMEPIIKQNGAVNDTVNYLGQANARRAAGDGCKFCRVTSSFHLHNRHNFVV